MTVAVLVVGAEGSGTRLMTRLLMAAGCLGGDDGVQAFDRFVPPATCPIVWRKSYPHYGRWPNLRRMAARGRLQGYEVRAVVMLRDWHALCASQVAAHHVATLADARWRSREAYRRIFRGLELAGLTQAYIPVTYEALVDRPTPVMEGVFRELGLPEGTPLPFPITDANAKYYKAQA